MQFPAIPEIRLEQRQSALFATLDRPKAKNALTAAMVEGLIDLCACLNDREDIRAVVLRGANGAFCAGGDIKEFAASVMAPEPPAGAPDPIAAGNRRFGVMMSALDALPQTFICAVEGPAFGGAMGILSVADVVIAAPGALFSLSETTLGLIPAQIGPFVVRKIGLFNARRLALTGARFDMEEALRIGLVSHACSAEGFSAAISETLSAVGRCAPHANAATKALFSEAGGRIAGDILDRAAADFARALRSEGRAGAGAFAMKQNPPWVEAWSETIET